MFFGIPSLNKFVSSITISQLDDFADRCNYFYTVLALLFFSVVIGAKQHFGAPIRCLVDRQYSDSWIGYVHDYCFISGRYSLTPPEYEADEIADFDPTNEEKYENYYQWVPFLLAAQALGFTCQICCGSDLDMAITVDEAIRICNMFTDERSKAVKDLVRYLEQNILICSLISAFANNGAGRHLTETCVIHPVRRSIFMNPSRIANIGWYSSLSYVLEKLLYVANSVLQLYVVNTFVGDGTLFWGYQLLNNLWSGQDWTITGHFPRVVYCDYMKHELANVQRKTVQCALAINILNEKVFALLSVWLLLLLVINVVSAIYIFTVLFTPIFREHSVSNYLQAFVCRERPLNNSSDNDGEFCENELSENHISNITSASFDSKIRRRLCAAIECDENMSVENEKTRKSEEQKQEMLYRRLVSLAYNNKGLLHSFVYEAMHPDSILLLRFMHSHAGGMVTSDIVFELWTDYVKAKESKRRKYQRIGNGIALVSCSFIKFVLDFLLLSFRAMALLIAISNISLEKTTMMLNDKYFSMSSPKIDSAIMDAGPLLEPNEEYAQVVDALNLCSSASLL
ncbi:Innexin [Dirofilaria immitis]|nr:Innexin [Dirofilaria immitis]